MANEDPKTREFQRKMFVSVLAHSREDKDSVFPPKEWVLSEFANSILICIGSNNKIANDKTVNYRSYYSVPYRGDPKNFEKDLWGYFEKEMRTHKDGLDPKIRSASVELVRCYEIPRGKYPSEKMICRTNLYEFFEAVFPFAGFKMEPLPERFIAESKDFLNNLQKHEQENVYSISEVMRKLRAEDMEEIRKSYSWL